MYCSLVALSSPIPFLSTKAQYIKSNRCRVIVLCLLHPYLVSVLFLASSLHVNYFFRKFFITSNNNKCSHISSLSCPSYTSWPLNMA